MNLDELQSVQARERQSSDLQHLRASFYREVGEYLEGLNSERAAAVERADDPFSAPEVRRLSDDIETAEQTVEAIYERRVGKVVKKASIAAAGMPVDDEGLTEEEAALFEDLVARIERNRETVLAVLDGDPPAVSCSIDDAQGIDRGVKPTETDPNDTTRGEAAEDAVNAADLMGGGEGEPSADDVGEASAEPATDPAADPLAAEEAAGPDRTPTEVPPERGPPGSASEGRTRSSREDEGDDTGSDGAGSKTPGIPRTTVRITADVGEVVGADDRDYDLGPEDVVTLPEPNAEVLVRKDAAERLE